MIRYLVGGTVVLGLVTVSYFVGQSTKEDELVAEYQRSYVEQYEAYRATEERLQGKITSLENKHYEEILDAEENVDELLDNIGSGTKRLYVKAKCPESSQVSEDGNTPVMDDESREAELDRNVARGLIRLTERGDKAIRKLSACQDYVRTSLEEINQ